tara:strand:+ start:456 stop:719 length:264 start_codon:yes stop_codon:yes gene_type:complete
MSDITRVPWSDREHDFLKECGKADVPFEWIDRALGRTPRSAASHAKATGLPASVWGGRVSYTKARQLRARFAIICAKHSALGLKIRK